MNTPIRPTPCATCAFSRRRFISRCTLGASTALLPAGFRAFGADPQPAPAAPTPPKARVRIVYALHGPQQTGPDWPNKGYDFRPFIDQLENELPKRCPGCQFVSSLATGPDQAKQILAADREAGIDGYLVYQMNCWNQVAQTLATSGKPVLYADFQFGGSGGFLVYNAAFLRQGAGNVGFVASSRFEDLAAAARCFEFVKEGNPVSRFADAVAITRRARTPNPTTLGCIPDPLTAKSPGDCITHFQRSRILALRDQESGPGEPIMGIPVTRVAFSELNDAWKTADKDQARAVAKEWSAKATAVEDVSKETLEACAAMYLAEKALLKKYNANAITINCLGGFYGGHIHAYPCLGFHQLLNEGMVGGCECDVRSTAAMVLFTTLTQGRPGYISDPVIDTAKRQIIYAHCVASNRPFGPHGRPNPYQILTHSEDRQGASVRSVLPSGYLTTTIEIAPERKEILLHQARTMSNDPDDRACRTKLAAEPVGDIERLFTAWDQWGWHRVTCYGDLRKPIIDLAGVLGWNVVNEA
jgi:hypothetical protein